MILIFCTCSQVQDIFYFYEPIHLKWIGVDEICLNQILSCSIVQDFEPIHLE